MFILSILSYFFFFILIDYILGKKIRGKYYFNHFINNIYIVYLTLPDVINTYTNFDKILDYPVNYEPALSTIALHSYHIVNYYDRLRIIDWMHHILMVVFAVPVGISANSGSLLGHSLFYLTGLPGAIDYILLFLAKNNYIENLVEKKINSKINIWLRCPGCIAHSTICMLSYFSNNINYTLYDKASIIFTSLLVFLNGIYFMKEVLVNYTLTRYQIKN